METTCTMQRKETRFVDFFSSFIRKPITRTVEIKKVEKDYSAFGNTTAYEKKVIDSLRADGLADDEIRKCLLEL